MSHQLRVVVAIAQRNCCLVEDLSSVDTELLIFYLEAVAAAKH
jgi:hypothetical protein